MFDYIKKFRQDRELKRLKGMARNKKIENLEQVRNIGIVFEVGDESQWNILYHFVKAMEKTQKKVSMIGYQHANTELSYIITHAQTTICHEKEDFTFWNLPKEEVIEPFVRKHYDLLIDITYERTFFSQYVTLRSLADLKVAYAEDEAGAKDDIFDMTIRGDGPMDLKDYLNNVVNYLNMIKK